MAYFLFEYREDSKDGPTFKMEGGIGDEKLLADHVEFMGRKLAEHRANQAAKQEAIAKLGETLGMHLLSASAPQQDPDKPSAEHWL
jgi:hypothetical protein